MRGSKLQKRSKATFDILMAKYKEGKAGIRGAQKLDHLEYHVDATDYFTKWTEAVPLKNMTHREVIHFISKHIIHRFGIPRTLTID
jgi:hypothetical protein